MDGIIERVLIFVNDITRIIEIYDLSLTEKQRYRHSRVSGNLAGNDMKVGILIVQSLIA
jgi:hypothetical protein